MARGKGCTAAQQAATRGTAFPVEGAGPTDAELVELFGEHCYQARRFLDGGELRGGTAAAPREMLEWVLAAEAGLPEAEWAAANAHRPWSELYLQARGEAAEYDDREPHTIAVRLEDNLRGYNERRRSTWLNYRRPDGEIAAAIGIAARKLGPGARSGQLADYSRGELCRLLGYLQREAKELSDEQLRAMALDAGLVPNYRGAPSHLDLALRSTYGARRTPRALRAFHAAMRKPYRELHSSFAGDLGQRDPYTLCDELRAEHPRLVRALEASGERKWVYRFCENCGIETRIDEAERHVPEVEQQFVSSLERRHGATLHAHLASIGGGRLTAIIGHATDGRWGRQNAPGEHTLAYYSVEKGEMHLSPGMDKIIRDAEQGKASAPHRYEAVESLAHELEHAASGGNGNCNYEGKTSAEQTIEEGEVEILARLNTDKLGKALGLCSPDESLRADGRNFHQAYPFQTETMCTVYAAATGELDTDWAKQGGYREPEGLSAEARELVATTHHETGLFARDRKLAELISARNGMDAYDCELELGKIFRLCHNPIFTKRFAPNIDQRRKLFSEYLADRLRKLLDGQLTA
jgi:hypothetical protein